MIRSERLLFAFALVGVGCGGGGGGPIGGDTCTPEALPAIAIGDEPMNNAATLQGAPVGLGSFERSCEVRRRVPVAVTRAVDGLRVNDQAFLLRASPWLSSTVTAIVPVRNDGTSLLCSGQSIDVVLIGAGGAVISSEKTDLVGSVASILVSATNSCLGPGESGFVQGGTLDTTLARPLWDEVTLVEISVNELFNGTARPGASLVPRSYAVTDSALTLTFENVSAFAARTGGPILTYVLLLDASGLPIELTTFDLGPEVTIQPGGTGTTVNTYLPYFPGPATRLRAFLEFQ